MQSPKNIIREIRQVLKAESDPAVRAGAQRFFKEPVKVYGVKTPRVRSIAKTCFAGLKELPKETVFTACESLLQTQILEESVVACDWVQRLHRLFEPEDGKVFGTWIGKYMTNWAVCDTFCNHTVGTFLEMYPLFARTLPEWAMSVNRWKRRAAAVSLILPARKGLFHREIFGLAELLLTDAEDMVQKGYGWMLKAASEFDETAVLRFVMKHKSAMPRTALRYAVEKMPPELRKKAMQK
ncbi:MAG: DNA alkylation repair protein [Planctomycetaceae bacterium]|jgi:3-methyladenine DNA glycosylase AlkD|nr:DNA alkylation repair protein [Planctomycetaceae bacterium]